MSKDKLREAVVGLLLDDPFVDDIYVVGTSQQTERVKHYAESALALMQPEIDRRAAEERARLLERLRGPTYEMVRRLNAACDTPDVQMAWIFPYIADMLAAFEQENEDGQ